MLKYSLALFFFLNQTLLQAAPCCSSSSANPALITGDHLAQLTFSASHSRVIGDAPEQGIPIFRTNNNETTQVFRVDATTILTDRLQAGLGVPVQQHYFKTPAFSAQNTHLADLQMHVAYETLPEWEYSVWKPKIISFLQVIFPTGQSVYEVELSKASGRGVYSLALGSLFIKSWNEWDAYLTPELHYALPRTFRNNTRLKVGFGSSLSLGVGFSPYSGNFRIGLRLQPQWNQSKTIETTTSNIRSSPQRSWDTAIESSYLIQENWSILLSYVDQTLIGPAQNTTLSRTVAAGAQYRWDR